MKRCSRPYVTQVIPTLVTMVALAACYGAALGSPFCDPGGPYSEWWGCPIEFDASASEAPGGTIISYQWNFGDGTTGQGVRPTHTYYFAPYEYPVSLSITDNHGDSSACSTSAYIDSDNLFPPLECDAGGPYSGEIGTPIQFDGTAYTLESPTYRWDFGDGSMGKGLSTTHTYTSNGTYIVRLEVSDLLPFACHLLPRNGSSEAIARVGVEAIESTTWGTIKALYR